MKFVAGSTSTRSKTADSMFGGPGGPAAMVRAQGCRVWTAHGQELIDWTMALGAVSLGYGHPHVSEAAIRAVRDGTVGPLPPVLEGRLAERLVAAYPGAERARFFKTGAEAVQGAVRLARTITGRSRVLYCGYHGWLDGPTTSAGVPGEVAELWISLPFDDEKTLETAARAAQPAAIIIEPFIDRAPKQEWLRAARRFAHENGALLIFDEIKTAFRIARGGAAEAWGIAPDLAVLGKAMANGYPLAAVLGRAELMERVRDTWISSTLATEYVSLAAADAVLDVWEDQDVAAHIARIGKALMDGLAEQATGSPWMITITADVLECVKRGVLIKRGAYNFPSLAHTDDEVRVTLEALRR